MPAGGALTETGSDAGRKPDALELKVRMACGALFGLVLGVGCCIASWPLNGLGACASIMFAMIACGWCAMRFGDGFWMALKWFR